MTVRVITKASWSFIKVVFTSVLSSHPHPISLLHILFSVVDLTPFYGKGALYNISGYFLSELQDSNWNYVDFRRATTDTTTTTHPDYRAQNGPFLYFFYYYFFSVVDLAFHYSTTPPPLPPLLLVPSLVL